MFSAQKLNYDRYTNTKTRLNQQLFLQANGFIPSAKKNYTVIKEQLGSDRSQ
ncbi:hypothetical protein [Nostoc sp.]|uniref:hypothetical protein n=1 Tax=Nostoc sp. TaxID=1180 RepID=UPI002FFBEC8E